MKYSCPTGTVIVMKYYSSRDMPNIIQMNKSKTGGATKQWISYAEMNGTRVIMVLAIHAPTWMGIQLSPYRQNKKTPLNLPSLNVAELHATRISANLITSFWPYQTSFWLSQMSLISSPVPSIIISAFASMPTLRLSWTLPDTDRIFCSSVRVTKSPRQNK